VRTYLRRAALAGLFLAVPVWTAPAASAAPRVSPPISSVPAGPATSAPPSCPAPGHLRVPAWYGGGRVEALIGNLSPAPGSSAAVGATISFLVADSKPFRTPLSRDVVVIVNGVKVTATAGAQESGVPVTYANPRDQGPRSTNCEVPFSFALPAKINGTAHILVAAFGADGGRETIWWTLTVQTTALPSGAVGGVGVAAIGGLALMVVQLRRRRSPMSART
jgi:hypothetical protein